LIDILNDRFENAFDKLQVAKRGLQKSNFYSLDALLRLVENCLFLIEGNYDLAVEQTKKNLKFHHYHKEHPMAADFMAAHKLIPKLIKCHFDDVSLTVEDLNSLKGWKQGDLAFAGKLLDKAIKVYSPAAGIS
jgi:hypothetical protein